MNILHIGIKYWPYYEAFTQDSLQGIRGGGMTKYNHSLLPNLSKQFKTFMITQLLTGQEKVETDNDDITVYRLKTCGGRILRQIISNVGSLFIALKIVSKYRIDVIHGHMEIGIFFAFILSIILRKPVIGTPYSFPVNNLGTIFGKISKFLETKIYPRLDKLIFETEGNLQKLSEFRNIKYDNSVVINTGIDIPEKSKTFGKLDKIKIFFIGRIVKIKGLENLIMSLTLLNKEELEQVEVDIVGEGEEYDFLQQMIEENGLKDKVKMHGFVNESVSFFYNADIFVLPSYSEGLSIALLEAMSYGLVCVVNDFGLPFDDETVYVMENNNPESIAESFRYFINNKEKIPSFGKNARAAIEEGFSIPAFVKKYEKLLLSLKK